MKKYNKLKDESYTLKQNYNSKAVKYLEKENAEKALLEWDDFKGIKEQLASLGAYTKFSFDKRGVMLSRLLIFSHKSVERALVGISKSKTVFDYDIQAWVLSGFKHILKTLDFLQK